MEPILAFTGVMLIWTIGEMISRKTKARISMMLVASITFIIGFSTHIFPSDMLEASSFISLGSVGVGIVLVHLGTMMSMKNLKAQWRTFVVGSLTIVFLALILVFVSQLFFDRNLAVAGTVAVIGSEISTLMVQGRVKEIMDQGGNLGALSGALLLVLPLLLLTIKNLTGFLITGTILRKRALQLKQEYRSGVLKVSKETESNAASDSNESVECILPAFLQTPYATLFLLALAVYISSLLSQLTNGVINTYMITLLMGILLRHLKIFTPNVLTKGDGLILMTLSIAVITFGALVEFVPGDLLLLIKPVSFFIVATLLITFIVSYIIGKMVGYTGALAIAVGMSGFFGFPGTMILSKEAASSVAESEEERQVIEKNILPIMITAGFSTQTVTSVLVGGVIVGFITSLV